MTGDRIWNQPFSEASLLAAPPGIWERTLVLGGDDDRGEAPERARVTFQKAESYGPLLLVIGPEAEAIAFERFHALRGQFQHGFLVTVICDGPVAAAMERPVLAALIDEADEVLVIGTAEDAAGDIASNPRLHRIDAADAVAGILRAMRELGIADAHTADRVLPARRRFLPGRSAAS